VSTQETPRRRILDLSPLATLDPVEFEGRKYGMIRLEAVSPLDQELLLDLCRKADEAEGLEQTKAMAVLVCELIPDMDEETAMRIPVERLAAAIAWFFGVESGELKTVPTRPQTGAKSSRGSKPRTAATKAAG
jgi:hypothetical protein